MNPLRYAILLSLATPVFADENACTIAVPCPSCAPPLFLAASPAAVDAGREAADTVLSARRMAIVAENQYRAEGDVRFWRSDQFMWSEALAYDAEAAEGRIDVPLRFQDRDMLATASSARWSESGDSRLEGVQFQLRSGRGNGHADAVTITQQDLTRLDRASFTSCDPADPAWSIHTQLLSIDNQRKRATARNVTLRLGDVPVFYFPWLQFPTTDERASGLLAPTLGSSNNAGIDLVVPVYLNLAPEYDATISPRWIADRGVMLGGEFRYLGRSFGGELDFSYLGNDRKIEGNANDTRHSFDFKHRQRFGANWSLAADLRDVSDDRYFEDFGDSLTAVATSLLPSSAYLSGRGNGWTLSMGGDRVEVTDPRFVAGAEPYRRLPRIFGSYASTNLRGPVVGVDAEWVRFSKNDFIGGDRYDMTPWISWPFEGSSWFVRPRYAYRSTGYTLDRGTERSPTRNMPIASLDAGLYFERQSGSHGWTQTLEPRLFGLHVPYRDQDALPVFDTQELTFGFAQLFRENSYTGADRQTDAKQVALALSSRWLDAQGQERARIGLGQVHYFDPPRVLLPGAVPRTDSGSAYIAEIGIALSNDWSFNVAQQWDPQINHSVLSSAGLQYHFDNGSLVNLAYRYRRNQLEQVDVATSIVLNERWKLVARFNQSLLNDALLEAFAGFEYESCCMAVRLLGRRYVRNLEGDANNAIFVELELKGFARIGRDTEEFLQRAILGYR
ncbi:MAG: LPS assembly protein LptD [Pseudomonadota bacterium]|nr:LPS assembly protein LptD [Pseudomonadota bacterium]